MIDLIMVSMLSVPNDKDLPEPTMLEVYQEAILEACENAQANTAQPVDFKEAVLDAVKFWK